MSQSTFEDVIYLSPQEYRKIPHDTIVHWKKAGEWKIELYKNYNLILRKRGRNKYAKKRELKKISKRNPSCDIKSNIKRPDISWHVTAPVELRKNHEINLTDKEDDYYSKILDNFRKQLEKRNAKSKLFTFESMKLGTIRSFKFIEYTSR